ncbi:hemin uptake protein HemP [Marinicella rhabdoformis]|uniref:hemin uptake protein HemP n=1 Tax=Marinicella rhabdoformis TaxID=2580566 RepID=UPI0012AEDCDF
MRQTITLKNKTASSRTLQTPVNRNRVTLGLNSKSLFKDTQTVLLKHNNENYYLRLTKNNKVILTK